MTTDFKRESILNLEIISDGDLTIGNVIVGYGIFSLLTAIIGGYIGTYKAIKLSKHEEGGLTKLVRILGGDSTDEKNFGSGTGPGFLYGLLFGITSPYTIPASAFYWIFG